MNRPCPKCGEGVAVDCGYLVFDPYQGDYDCAAPDLETVNPSTLCDDCPHVWCEKCSQ
jgi:hypothetical protein